MPSQRVTKGGAGENRRVDVTKDEALTTVLARLNAHSPNNTRK